MMNIDDQVLGSTIDEALARDAVRRPQSRFAAGVVGGRHEAIVAALDEAILALIMLKRRLRDAEQDY